MFAESWKALHVFVESWEAVGTPGHASLNASLQQPQRLPRPPAGAGAPERDRGCQCLGTSLILVSERSVTKVNEELSRLPRARGGGQSCAAPAGSR
eukprot:SAG11_NODE_3455_length_2438_cov_1.565626_4_plen_96_part_00